MENKTEEFEFVTKTFPVTPDIQNELSQMLAEGWHVNPARPPTAEYHFVRRKGNGSMGVRGGLLIDESKITIVRGGQIVEG